VAIQNGVDVEAISNLAIGFPLSLELEAQLRVRVRVSGRVRVGLCLGLGVGLGPSLLFIAGCWCMIPRDRVLVHDTQPNNNNNL